MDPPGILLEQGHAAVALSLLRWRADPARSAMAPGAVLVRALLRGFGPAVAEELLAASASPNARGEGGFTALEAALRGRDE